MFWLFRDNGWGETQWHIISRLAFVGRAYKNKSHGRVETGRGTGRNGKLK